MCRSGDSDHDRPDAAIAASNAARLIASSSLNALEYQVNPHQIHHTGTNSPANTASPVSERS